ncbi:hydroxyacid dehydrogenase [Afifella pfennigii]|uniref:hydroxyacid dehydrogenase n=1 Tax=Afifella pfennigii TaxID=209897 RepID=UPI00047D816A|nr:hydroxyacid dehydrogenase [Afifella pfennigii]
MTPGQEKLKLVVFGKIAKAGEERLRRDGRFDLAAYPDHPPERLDAVSDADAIIVRMTAIDAELIGVARRLKCVARHGVGYDTVDLPALTARGIPLAVTGDVNSGAVAEHALALMLALAKRIPRYDRAVRGGDFAIRDSFAARELAGRRVLLVGYGRIGRKVARLARAFSMQVVVFDPFVEAAQLAEEGIEHAPDLHGGLSQADIVSVHAPKTAATTHIIDAVALGAMRPDAFLVNVARGGLVDEAALLAALDGGQIAGAGLDVFESEPPRPDDPLLKHDKTVLSPHSAAFTGECAERMALACAENVIGFFDGRLERDLVVNPETLV